MNTADRTLALVDYALRRRFAFVNLEPLFGSSTFVDLLEARGTDPVLAKAVAARLMELNQTIAEEHNLGPGFRIGHSYFCGGEAPLTEQSYKDAVEYELLPLLQEYWFDGSARLKDLADKLEAKFD